MITFVMSKNTSEQKFLRSLIFLLKPGCHLCKQLLIHDIQVSIVERFTLYMCPLYTGVCYREVSYRQVSIKALYTVHTMETLQSLKKQNKSS